MGLWSAIRSAMSLPWGTHVVEVEVPALIAGMTAEELYRTQPNLRTVIDFRARNVGQLGLQVFERDADNGRTRVTSSPLPRLLRRPNPTMTTYELVHNLVASFDLYDAAYWLVVPDADSDSGWTIRPIPPAWVTGQKSRDLFTVESYTITPPKGYQSVVPAEDMIVFHGWHPDSATKGSPTIDALRDVLAEQTEAWRFRMQSWERGGRVGAYLARPKDAPTWDESARERFHKGWEEFQRRGAKAGSTPLLEDGIELKRVGFSAREEQWLDVSKLSLQLVASAFHVNPAMVGQLDEANFASVREFRTMLYSETLGPLLAMIQDRLNAFLVPRIEPDRDMYVEFNIAAKLAGSFEEQASVLSTSVGSPWMTRNEARAKVNLPALDGGDELITPLNVTEGGQRSPQDGGAPVGAGPKADLQPVIDAWRARIDRSVPSKKAAGLPVDWARWERELTADLLAAESDRNEAAGIARQELLSAEEKHGC